MHILIVDDNTDAADVLAEYLGLKGHDTSVAYDAPGALAAAGVCRPDVAVIDLGLPKTDGCQLAAQLRALPGLGDLKLIAITGYATSSFEGRSRDAGFAAHLVKPVDLPTLLALIRGTD